MNVTNTGNVIEPKASDYNDDEELIDIDVLTPDNMRTMVQDGVYEEDTNYAGFNKEQSGQSKREEPQGSKEKSEQHDRNDNLSTKEVEASGSNDESSTSHGNVLYVKNIPISAREEDLETIFNDYGKVSRIDIIYDPHMNESRGFAFIEFSTAKDATNALNNAVSIQMRGKTLRVERARRGCPRSPTPGKYSGTKKDTDRRREQRDPYAYHPSPMMPGMFPYPPYGYPPQFSSPPPMHYSNYDRRDDHRKDDRDRYPHISPPGGEPYMRDPPRSPRRNDDTFTHPTRDRRDRSNSPRRDNYQPYPYPYPYMPYGYPPYGMDSRMSDRPPRSYRQDDRRRPRSPPQTNIDSERSSAPSYNAAPPPY